MSKIEEFISKVKVLNPQYEIDASSYINARSRVIVMCPQHGQFEALPCNLIKGTGCKQCAMDKLFLLKNERTFAKFITIINSNYDKFNYTYNYFTPLSYRTKVVLNCPIHGQLEQTVGSVIVGSKCIKCFNHRAKAPGGINLKNIDRHKIINIVCYVIKFIFKNHTYFKIGLSSNLRNRICHIKNELFLTNDDIEVIDIYCGSPKSLFNLEQYIVSKYYMPSDLRFKGYTEIISCNPKDDILNFISNTDIQLTTEYE